MKSSALVILHPLSFILSPGLVGRVGVCYPFLVVRLRGRSSIGRAPALQAGG